MQKARIKIKVNDYKLENEGILDNDVLTVGNSKDKITFDYKKLLLIKENNEYIINIDFKNKSITYALINEKQKFTNIFDIISLTNENKHVIINYRIEDAIFLLEINYETI